MTTRSATCACGQLTATCIGDPIRTSVCHCLACKQRSGSAFSWNARFTPDNVKISGTSKAFTRTGDEGSHITYHFCPVCGVTVHYAIDADPDLVAIPVGAFASLEVPAPTVSVYDPSRRAAWLDITADTLKRLD